MKTALVLDALEQAVWLRRRDGIGDLSGLIHHNDAGSQYTSIAFSERLAEVGIDPSVGSVGDAGDNALAESVIGLFKTELIKTGRPWRTAEQVEIVCLEYVDWFNRRLFESRGDIPPVELEQAHYRQHAALAETGHSTLQVPGHAGAVHWSILPRWRDGLTVRLRATGEHKCTGAANRVMMPEPDTISPA